MSHINTNIFQAIKQETDCTNLAHDLGLDINSSGMIRCPDPAHEDRMPSCKVYHDHLFCYGCGRRLDCFDVVMQTKNCDFITAARWLAGWLGIPWPEQSEEARQEYEKQLIRQVELQERIITWSKNLRREDMEYLKKRGFTEEFIREHSFGYCNQELPQDLEAARELGLLVTTKDGRDWYMPAERLIVPFFQFGRVVQIAFHKPGGEPKYLYPKDMPKPLISSVSPVRYNDPVYLVEGVFDYFSLVQAGLPAVTALGAQLSNNQKQELKKFKNVVVMFDGDESGRDAARILAQEFFPEVRWHNLPDGKDVNDEFKDRGTDMFTAFVKKAGKEAKNYLDILTDELKKMPSDTTLINDALAFMVRLDTDVERENYLNLLKETTGIGKTVLRNDLNRLSKDTAEADGNETEETQHDKLLKIAQQAKLFKDEHDTAFAQVRINSSLQNLQVRGRIFKMWLTGRFLAESGRGPNSEALNSALNTIAALAWESDKKYRLNVRVAVYGDSFYYDLADPGWRSVQIFPGGWDIVKELPEPLFKRYVHMQAQVEPVSGGNPWELLDFVNIPKDDKDGRLLYLVSTIADFIPDIPHTVKVIYGPGGATKTTAAKTGRSIIDPSSAPTCRSYRDKKEFMQYLAHNYSCLLDNLSGISPELSDLICSAVTGDGDSKRALFTDDDDIIYNFKRCFTINGINNVVTRPDLLRRAVLFALEPPKPAYRMEEREYWRRFERTKPRILGGIFDILSQAMKIYPDVKLTGLYDMADFTRWGAAITKALGIDPKKFLTAYSNNKAKQNKEAVANNAVATAITSFMADKDVWEGNASTLLEVLEKVAESEKIDTRARGWPKAANSLSRKLNELKTTLQAAGVSIKGDKQNQRIIFLERTPEGPENIVETVQTVESPIKSGFTDRRYLDDIKTISSIPDNTVSNIVESETHKNRHSNDMDDIDDTLSNSGETSEKNNFDDSDSLLEVEI